MNAITQAIVNHSKLEVSLVKITDATPDSFMMAIESRITGTGPISSTVSPMTVDLVGPSGAFGRLDLPAIKNSSSGVDVHIPAQRIQIIDKVAFKAFVTALLRDESLVLQLKNGKGVVKALAMSSEINYNKDVPMKGMHGPKTSITKTEITGGGFKNTLVAVNPSPVEIDLGTMKQELKNSDGSVFAVQKGQTYLKRGETTYVVTGKATGKAVGGQATLAATGVEENNWHNETITAFEVPVILPQELAGICAA